jgi:dihydroflavonol-4-reductase
MASVFVTGGTGFVGGHVVRALLRRGEAPRCLVRPGSSLGSLEGLDVEAVRGDLSCVSTLARSMAGATTVFHCAADYRLYARDPRQVFAANVEGTRNLLRAAGEAGVGKIVHTSSVGALGRSSGEGPADERTPVCEADMVGPYKRSKYQAERVAEAFAATGLPVVIVNPSTPVGELDVKPTPTGQMIVRFLSGRMPAYVETGLNLVDVRDVAQGHLLAAERGRIGEKYILGHKNMSLKEILERLARLAGLPAPRLRLPHAVPLAIGALDTLRARLLGGTPEIPLDGVLMARKAMYFDSGRAVRELGLPQSPVEDALARAVLWFREKGYAPAG